MNKNVYDENFENFDINECTCKENLIGWYRWDSTPKQYTVQTKSHLEASLSKANTPHDF